MRNEGHDIQLDSMDYVVKTRPKADNTEPLLAIRKSMDAQYHSDGIDFRDFPKNDCHPFPEPTGEEDDSL